MSSPVRLSVIFTTRATVYVSPCGGKLKATFFLCFVFGFGTWFTNCIAKLILPLHLSVYMLQLPPAVDKYSRKKPKQTPLHLRGKSRISIRKKTSLRTFRQQLVPPHRPQHIHFFGSSSNSLTPPLPPFRTPIPNYSSQPNVRLPHHHTSARVVLLIETPFSAS